MSPASTNRVIRSAERVQESSHSRREIIQVVPSFEYARQRNLKGEEMRGDCGVILPPEGEARQGITRHRIESCRDDDEIGSPSRGRCRDGSHKILAVPIGRQTGWSGNIPDVADTPFIFGARTGVVRPLVE